VSDTPSDLSYTSDHEWVRVTGDDTVRVGITDYAQAALGDVVFVDLPSVGDEVTAGNEFGNVESTKSQSELYSPITAKVVAVNEDLSDSPELVNSDPYGAGWLIDLQVPSGSLEDAVSELLDADGYRATLDE
jgi:glycine cleavage system H protein